ncbi:hypothetical protein D9M71_141650 [compost metagenome]
MHFRHGLAEVHRMDVRVDHQLLVWRRQQYGALFLVLDHSPGRPGLVYAVDLTGDGGVGFFARRIEVGAVSAVFRQVLEFDRGFERLQPCAQRCRRIDLGPLWRDDRCGDRCARVFLGCLGRVGPSFERQPAQ